MSAYICKPVHIATCAAIIMESVKFDDPKPSAASIAVELARENIISVSYRYGPEGRAAYAPILKAITSTLADAGWKPSQTIESNNNAGKDNQAIHEMLAEEETPASYIAQCRWAKPIEYTKTEAIMYLTCLRYQSNEHNKWKESDAYKWSSDALAKTGV